VKFEAQHIFDACDEAEVGGFSVRLPNSALPDYMSFCVVSVVNLSCYLLQAIPTGITLITASLACRFSLVPNVLPLRDVTLRQDFLSSSQLVLGCLLGPIAFSECSNIYESGAFCEVRSFFGGLS